MWLCHDDFMSAKYCAGLWIGFLIGVAIGSWYTLNEALISVLVSAVLIMAGAGVILGRKVLVIFIVLGLAIGLWHISKSFHQSEYSFGQTIDIDGVVAVDPP